MLEAALALGVVNFLGGIFLYRMISNNYAEDNAVKKNLSGISEKVVELIQNEDAEYWKIMKKIIWKDNYLAERITELEEDMKRNFKEDTERWLDEIDDDHAVYAKIMTEVDKRINETLENDQASESLYKRILFKLKHSPDKGPNKLKKLY